MLFNSVEFIIFFPIVIAAYYIIPIKIRYLWLLAASYFFYMSWNPKYALLLLASTSITYFSSRMIARISSEKDSSDSNRRLRKTILFVSIISNLSILFFFKYFNLFVGTTYKVLNCFRIPTDPPVFDIVLPVGISFYIFQALSYTIDVYRGEVQAENNFLRYALFVSFFPQLVAGPIERSKNLLSQLKKTDRFDFDRFREGFLLMLWGYFLKLVIADRIAVIVDTIYGNPKTYAGFYLIVATILFGFQIYCDFAGYSTIAIGAAQILGIKLMENFRSPYLSQNVSEFWRNWHISLTSWFRDYVYIPLGGNKKGKMRKYFNIIVVFLLSGLWHGASFSFVLWGGINGIYQVVGEIIKPIRNRIGRFVGIKEVSFGVRACKIVTTFALVDFAWLFFRAGSLSETRVILKSLFVFNPWILFDGSLFKCGLNQKNLYLAMVSLLVLLVADVMKLKGIKIRNKIMEQDWIFQSLFIAVSMWLLLLVGMWGNAYDAKEFIYFQF